MAARNSLPKVRLLREFGGGRGTVWREYADQRGRRTIVQAKGPGGRRKAPRKSTERTAAQRFAGWLA
jgi:hypothetical protein